MIPTPDWYAEGLHWIGSLFVTPGHVDRPSFARPTQEPRPEYLPPEEYLFDVRHRLQSRF